jgi:DNA-binding MarR family transcriptional regulator
MIELPVAEVARPLPLDLTQVAEHGSHMNRRSRKPLRRPADGDRIVFSVLGTAHALEARLESALGRAGLSLAKIGVLSHLAAAREPLPLRELAERLSCVRSNITQLVDRLEKDGLVRRRSDPQDRRSVRAALTPAGERAYGKGMQVLALEQRAIVRALSAGDAKHLTSALQLLAR